MRRAVTCRENVKVKDGTENDRKLSEHTEPLRHLEAAAGGTSGLLSVFIRLTDSLLLLSRAEEKRLTLTLEALTVELS